MKTSTQTLFISLGVVVASIAFAAFFLISQNGDEAGGLPRLAVRAEKIIRTDTDEPVLLRGAVSDYFRYGQFNSNLVHFGLESELMRLKKLKDAGANVIGLYLADSILIREHITELDAYVKRAGELRMYVYFMPVAREFNNRPDPADHSRNETYEDLDEFLGFLSDRYGIFSQVLYGLGAEPEGEDFESWHEIQVMLTKTVRANSDAPILITGFRYVNGLLPYMDTAFPDGNVVYLGGGYVGKDDAEVAERPDLLLQQVTAVRMDEFAKKLPYIAGEFGGNYGGDFSSPNDLEIIRAMLSGMNDAGTSYTMYRLSSNFENDSLALFDLAGNVGSRGAVFFDALQQSPPTQF